MGPQESRRSGRARSGSSLRRLVRCLALLRRVLFKGTFNGADANPVPSSHLAGV